MPAANHYKAIELEIYKKKSIKNTISKSHLPRFKVTERTLNPSPSSYNTAKTDEYFRATKVKHGFGKTKRTSFIDSIYNIKNKSPGAGTYKLAEAAYPKLSKSPSPRRRS